MIAQAVADPAWQKFRLSLKGLPTKEKLHRLLDYDNETRQMQPHESQQGLEFAERIIRVDNYLKALARGGQIAVSNGYMTGLRDGKIKVQK